MTNTRRNRFYRFELDLQFRYLGICFFKLLFYLITSNKSFSCFLLHYFSSWVILKNWLYLTLIKNVMNKNMSIIFLILHFRTYRYNLVKMRGYFWQCIPPAIGYLLSSTSRASTYISARTASEFADNVKILSASSSKTIIVTIRLLDGSIPDTITNSGGTRRMFAIIHRSFSNSGL